MKQNLYDMIQQRQISPQGCTDNTTSTTRHHNGTKPTLGGILRKFLAILMLMTISISTWAADYVISYTNGGTTYYLASGSGRLQVVTTFDEATCVWHCETSDGTPTTLSTTSYSWLYQEIGDRKKYITGGTGFTWNGGLEDKHSEYINHYNYQLMMLDENGYLFSRNVDWQGTPLVTNYFSLANSTITTPNTPSAQCAKAIEYVDPTPTNPPSSDGAGYVLFSGSSYYGYDGGTPTFAPNGCIWIGDGGKLIVTKNTNSRYLRLYVNNLWVPNLSLTATGDDYGTNISLSNDDLSTTGAKVYYQGRLGSYYLRYNNGWTATNSNNNASNVLFEVQKITHSESTAEPEIYGDAIFATTGTKNYTHSSAAYIRGYLNYIFYNNTNHYFELDNETPINSIPTAEEFSYTWSLSANAFGHVTVISSTGEVSYNTLFDTPTDITLILTANSTNKTYTIEKTIRFETMPQVTTPSISFTQFGDVTITCAEPGSQIFYTTNDDTPTSASNLYSGTFNVEAGTTIKAIAIKDGYRNSEVATAICPNRPQVPTPTISFSSTGLATITCALTGATIYYTSDNTNPTTSATSQEYTEPIAITEATTIKAFATKTNYISSTVATLEIAQLSTPTITNNGTQVTISGSEAGVTYYYTLDGSVPSTSSNIYSVPLVVSEITSGSTIKAMAVKNGCINSSVATFVVKQTLPAPSISFAGTSCTLSSNVDGVDIYYTIDGSTPSTDSYNYTTAFTCASGVTVKAIAVKTNYNDSPITEMYFSTGGNGTSESQAKNIYSAADLSQLNNSNLYYKVMADFSASSNTSISNFTGTLDGNYHIIKGLTQPLFETVTNATIKNVVLEAVSISSTATNVGPLVCTAGGNTVIYNCGVRNTYNTDPANKIYAGKKKADGRPTLTSQSTVSGGTNVGGLVGQLRGNAKVINCYSYANVIGGTNCAGIVGDRGDNGTEITNTTQVVIKHVSSGRLLTENNAALQIVTERNWGTWQYWYLEPTVGGYKLKNVGRGEYIAQGTANTWTAVFNTTGDVYTLVPQGNGIFYVHGSNGNLGTNNDNNESTVFTNKGTNDRNRWELYVNGQKVNSLNHTMVANCMFYGNITGGTNKYPVYGGTNIDNTKYPIYDYFKLDSISYRDNIAATNSALPAEARFLERFEYFRATLNSNKRLTAWYITGNSTQTDVVGKWVLDRAIAPFPIIKPWGKYPSLINPDYESNGQLTDINDSTQRYRGKVMGYLSVTINSGTQGGSNSKTIQIPISDMDTANYDFNYYKIQLPYYNDHWNNKYQAAKVVTGWRITGVTGETDGTWATTGTNAYNFADRNCTAKDLYSTSNRIFAEGGFYNVPEGVTAITIEANWANAVYVCDQYLDKVYNKSYTATNFTAAGGYGTTGFRNVTFTNRYNSLNDAYGSNTLTSNNNGSKGNTNVYNNAIVLIGNLNEYRGDNGVGNTDKGYTIMSIDMDGDNEPDFAQRYAHRDIRDIAPSRWDFVYQVGLSWIKKPYDAAMQAYSGIAHNLGHFEITETAFARYTEFETGTTGNSNSPLIFNGGLIDQFVVSRNNNNANVTYINYAILGGHTYFNAFTPGVHANYNARTQLFPVSVLGGEYAEFYLTGRKAEVEVDDDNHGRVYSNGGRIGTYCSGYWEQLNGNATIRFDHIIIDTFFGGSLNPAKPITGNIDIVINNSLVDFYCGGSKAGNMSANSSVHTVANNTVFGTFMGAGYGGSSVARFQQREHVSTDGSNDIGGVEYTYPKTQYMADYFKTANNNGQNNYLTYTANRGILIRYHIEYMPGSGGFNWADVDHPVQVTRWFNEYAQLSLARCYSVTSELNNCLVKGNFYGGACYGTVGTSTNTQTINSTLTNCTVRGNVHGAGKSAAIPSITVFPVEQSALVTPLYNPSLAIYYQPGCEKFPTYPQGTQYTWVSQTGTPTANTTNKTLGTDADLNNLGTVFGNINLTLDGGHMYGHVFGGGEASKVTGNTNVVVKGPIIVEKNVYGGGNAGEIGGDTQVTIGE